MKTGETIQGHTAISASPEVAVMLNNLNELKLARNVRPKMSNLLNHLKASIGETMKDIDTSGRQTFIAGPQWCRDNAESAGKAHAQVIVDTYGDSYALPNKHPDMNTQAIASGELEMFLMFNQANNEPIGTACMVLDGGWAEVGRVASKGHVGNRLIQDLRVVQWLTDERLSQKFHSLFATLRTAPDRDIGEAKLMRGGQAACHIWADTPGATIAGFGPLYKKHGALEQFARMLLTKEEMNVSENLWVLNESENGNDAFVLDWLKHNGWGNDLPNINTSVANAEKTNPWTVAIHFPPPELGITEYVHGDLTLEESGGMPVDEGVKKLCATGVPFMQFAVPVDRDTLDLQKQLMMLGFQAFQFTPGLGDGVEVPLLWFGKVNGNIPVVPTFWKTDTNFPNPFWRDELANHAERIANGWRLPVNN